MDRARAATARIVAARAAASAGGKSAAPPAPLPGMNPVLPNQPPEVSTPATDSLDPAVAGTPPSKEDALAAALAAISSEDEDAFATALAAASALSGPSAEEDYSWPIGDMATWLVGQIDKSLGSIDEDSQVSCF